MSNELTTTLPPVITRGSPARRTNVEKWALEIGRIFRQAKSKKMPIDEATKLTYIARQAADLWEKAETLRIGAELTAQIEKTNGKP